MIKAYISYLLKAKDEHSLHSPFVFDLYTKVIKPVRKNIQSPHYQPVEALRKKLKKDTRKILITDFGAGSKKNKSNERQISEIAKNAEKAPKFGQLFYQLIQYFNYQTVFDLGTSLGITTAYEALAVAGGSRDAKFCVSTVRVISTFEGCPETAKIAQENFDRLGIKNTQIVVGNIDETLPKKLAEIEKLDFVFFDANHRYEPTVRYFEQCLAKAHEDSLFIFDDIYWSEEMTKAWRFIKNHESVTITIDLFFVGLVFFRKKQSKQHFILKF